MILKEIKLKQTQKDLLVIKSNSLINAKGRERYSRNELKLIANLVAHIGPYDTNLEDKKIALKDLGFIIEDTKNHSFYDKYFEELMAKPFKFDGYWFNWFSRLKYENGFIYYSFDEKLKPFLLELKANFTKYHLENILNLGSSYSIHIYELLKQFEDKRNRSILLDDFRETLNIPKSYKNNDISKLLSRVQEDLAKNTNIKFNFKFGKLGRSFNRIDFVIMKNKKVEKVETLEEYEERYETSKTLEDKVIIHENQRTIDDYLNNLENDINTKAPKNSIFNPNNFNKKEKQ